MRRGRFTDEQVIRIRKVVEAGVTEKEACRKHDFSEQAL